jgi:oxygen-independent coproporphyrinogen-3 oxidase
LKSFSTAKPDEKARHVYIHVPFCSRRCSYCDFSIAVRRNIPVAAFVAAMGVEAEGRLAPGRVSADTLYLGGGTPSKLGAAGVRQLTDALAAGGIRPAPGAEVTLEANPEDVTRQAVEAWIDAGVTRLSLGVQSFDPGVLEWMHRTHTPAQAEQAVGDARSAGVKNLSVDLIYALPARLGRDWGRDLDQAIALEPEHLSLYGLTVEPRTPLGRWWARGAEVAEADDAAASQFLEAHARLTAAGYEHYEVSNYARPGYRSAHNSAYWKRKPYVGLGPSAHSFDGRSRRWNLAAYAAWERTLAAGSDPQAGEETLTPAQVAAEEMYLGLRTDEGATLDGADLERANAWEREGWAVREGNLIKLTPEGWLRLDALAATVGGRGV